jgi:hypothetical protein
MKTYLTQWKDPNNQRLMGGKVEAASWEQAVWLCAPQVTVIGVQG